jgi:hypothetical protein
LRHIGSEGVLSQPSGPDPVDVIAVLPAVTGIIVVEPLVAGLHPSGVRTVIEVFITIATIRMGEILKHPSAGVPVTKTRSPTLSSSRAYPVEPDTHYM